MFDAVYCSPLCRAKVTAQIVCDRLDVNFEPIVIHRLVERDFGIMTGKPSSEIERLCSPDIIKTDTITYFLCPIGAETFPDLIRRGSLVLNHVNSLHSTGNVLLVCHGDIGKMIYVAATGKHWEDVLRNFHFGNGDLIEVGNTKEAHVVKLPQQNL